MVIEDLVSTGKSSLSAVDALREEGLEVKGMVAIFTYSFDLASKNFEKAGCSLETLSDYPTLIAEAEQREYLTSAKPKRSSLGARTPKRGATSSPPTPPVEMTEIRSRAVEVAVSAAELQAHLADLRNMEAAASQDKVKAFPEMNGRWPSRFKADWRFG